MTRQRLLEAVGRSARLDVLNALKRSISGMAVRQLAEQIGMSYMGVKDLCVDLERQGLLTTWRDPQVLGRPRMLYRLTERAHELFPATSNALTIELLQITHKVYGAAAPEKLLLHVFQHKAETYRARVRGDTLAERAAALARVREAEGCMCALEKEPEGTMRLIEHHSPILDILAAYPSVGRMEAQLFQQVLGVPVERTEERVAGLFRATFALRAAE